MAQESSIFSNLKNFIDSNILFELNENDVDLVPSGLTDFEFERFMEVTPKQKQKDLQEWIHRIAWEKDRPDCYVCKKQLGILNGRFNCYKCGHQVCLEHSLFQMKLSALAKHDPVNGIWARVCQSCFQSTRVQQRGVSRSKTASFLSIRKQKVTQLLMESNKIEKRLKQIKQNFELKNSREVVPWVPNSAYHDCYICHINFGLLNRKHHCRLCGQLICHNCSKSIPITVRDGIRSCLDCAYLLSLRTLDQIIQPSPIIPYYDSIKRHQVTIQQTIERFRALVIDIQQKKKTIKDQEYQAALGLRKQILESFSEMDHAAKAIKRFDGTGSTRRLYDNIFTSVMIYLQQHMFTLEALPFQTSDTVAIEIETEETLAIKESIRELETALDDCIAKRRLEDAESLRNHIQQLKEELSRIQTS